MHLTATVFFGVVYFYHTISNSVKKT